MSRSIFKKCFTDLKRTVNVLAKHEGTSSSKLDFGYFPETGATFVQQDSKPLCMEGSLSWHAAQAAVQASDLFTRLGVKNRPATEILCEVDHSPYPAAKPVQKGKKFGLS